jgi:hypothetical protein
MVKNNMKSKSHPKRGSAKESKWISKKAFDKKFMVRGMTATEQLENLFKSQGIEVVDVTSKSYPSDYLNKNKLEW